MKHVLKGNLCEYLAHLKCNDYMKTMNWLPFCQNQCTRPCREVRYKSYSFQTGNLKKYIQYENKEIEVTVVLGTTKRRIVQTLPRMLFVQKTLWNFYSLSTPLLEGSLSESNTCRSDLGSSTPSSRKGSDRALFAGRSFVGASDDILMGTSAVPDGEGDCEDDDVAANFSSATSGLKTLKSTP
ncbi:hypothetical protein MRX96_010909 [Rhipicephalus microplus]